MSLHFLSKDFEILDLDPSNNPTSHYGACHFGYSFPLKFNRPYNSDLLTSNLVHFSLTLPVVFTAPLLSFEELESDFTAFLCLKTSVIAKLSDFHLLLNGHWL